MKELINKWYSTNNGHPYDDEMFYEIVVKSLNQKLSEIDFEDVIKSKEKSTVIYKRYEDLRNCVLYLKKSEL